jgi:ketosteroid isomerase-like protein
MSLNGAIVLGEWTLYPELELMSARACRKGTSAGAVGRRTMRSRVRKFIGWATWLLPLIVVSALPASRAPAGTANSARAEIRNLLLGQQAAWTRGDLDDFLAGYWQSDTTAFAGAQGILHGWQALRERYRKGYPDRRAMGTLEFSELEITPLCPDAALVLGNWQLEREAGPVGGVFSLVLRHFPEGWRIVADHTSVVPKVAGD